MQKEWIGFGIAGNFAHHLEQAGESADFVDVEVDSADAPKGIFPTYVPHSETFLSIYPFSHTQISAPQGREIQMEPEVALVCDLSYEGGVVSAIRPTHFCAYNDCSIRIEGAPKISHKKNWGENSKALSPNLIEIDRFEKGGVMDCFSLCSFVQRDGKWHEYGENSELLGYSYFYQKLLDWIQTKLNTQHDHGPLEDLPALLKIADYPQKMLISIGATRYTPFGETHYLQKGDRLVVITYDHTRYPYEEIRKLVEADRLEDLQGDVSVLDHRVI